MATEPLFLPRSESVEDTTPETNGENLGVLSQNSEAPSSMAPPFQKQSYVSQSRSPSPSRSQFVGPQSQAPQPQSPFADSQTQPVRRYGKGKKRALPSPEDEESVSKMLKTGEEEDSMDKDIVGVLLGEVDGIGKSGYRVDSELMTVRIVIKHDQIILIGRSPAK